MNALEAMRKSLLSRDTFGYVLESIEKIINLAVLGGYLGIEDLFRDLLQKKNMSFLKKRMKHF